MHPAPLYVVSTPVGNLGDITLRALETLRAVSVVLAEDTRHTRHLLDHYGITTPMEAYHEHNEARLTPLLTGRLSTGEPLALVSDAGTPLLSDPGARLVRAAVAAGIPVVPVPGASALLSALVASGLAADRFTFYGFLPRRSNERRQAVADIAAHGLTSVLYEAPARVAETLAELAGAGAEDRQAVVARELTKHFEEFRRGTVAELAQYYGGSAPRGEVVLLIAGARPTRLDEAALRERARALRSAGATVRDVVRTLVEESGAPRNLAYRLAQDV